MFNHSDNKHNCRFKTTHSHNDDNRQLRTIFGISRKDRTVKFGHRQDNEK